MRDWMMLTTRRRPTSRTSKSPTMTMTSPGINEPAAPQQNSAFRNAHAAGTWEGKGASTSCQQRTRQKRDVVVDGDDKSGGRV
jgi:hypothetical protein